MKAALSIALAAALLVGSPAWAQHHPATKAVTHRQRIGQWTLSVTHDPFSGATNCALRARGMSYDHGAMTFSLGSRVRTYGALYRIDDGQAVSWRENAMALAAVGALAPSEDLDNPSAGRVVVPVKFLLDAETIAIRPSPKESARVFRLSGLADAMTRGGGAGCGPDYPADTVR